MNKTLAETMYTNIQTVGLPTWDEADQTLARALQKKPPSVTEMVHRMEADGLVSRGPGKRIALTAEGARNPLWDPVRADPRFARLRARMRLAR